VTGVSRRHGERFLVTGALGCIGAWTVREKLREHVPVVAFERRPPADDGLRRRP
jgi:uncharacterized protein YbjT (DUF2867 family)